MLSIQIPDSRKEACSLCRTRKVKCVVLDSTTTCVGCEKGGVPCQLPASRIHPAMNGKRKQKEANIIPESGSIIAKRATSTDSVSRRPRDSPPPPDPSPKISRNPNRQSKPLKSSSQRSNSSEICHICNGDRRSVWRNRLDTDRWVQCEFQTCRSWYHLSCLSVAASIERPSHYVFSPSITPKHAMLFCPKCLDQTNNKGYDKDVFQAMQSCMRAKEARTVDGERPPSSCEEPEIQNDKNNQTIQNQREILGFELPRQERYQGFDEDVIRTLVRRLHQSIYDYDLELRLTMDRFPYGKQNLTTQPLETWGLVDPAADVTTGKQWFEVCQAGDCPSTSHTPITAALRRIFSTPADMPFEIGPDLKHLDFSQVHIGLISWFVFDIVNNEVNMYDLPNMKAMRTMMAAVHQSAEERWGRGNGHLHLREVQLRTWSKPDFQSEILSNEEQFRHKMENFLEPLTKDVDKINAWSQMRSNVIECAIKLWSYLQSSGVKLELIQPAVGSVWDFEAHDAYDKDNIEQLPEKHSKKKILWVLSRGFRLEEDGIEEPRVLVVKARIIVQ